MPPRNSRNTTSPLLTHATEGLHVPTADATLNLKRMYHLRRSQLSPLSRVSLASSYLLTLLLCFSPTFPGRRCAPLHDFLSSPFTFCSASLLLCCPPALPAAFLHSCPSSTQLLFAASLLLRFSSALLFPSLCFFALSSRKSLGLKAARFRYSFSEAAGYRYCHGASLFAFCVIFVLDIICFTLSIISLLCLPR